MPIFEPRSSECGAEMRRSETGCDDMDKKKLLDTSNYCAMVKIYEEGRRIVCYNNST
jgi:hypothetical protein